MGGGKRNQPTQQLPDYSTSSRLMNMFSVLEDSDTEEELELVPEDSTYSSEGEVDVGDGIDGDGLDDDEKVISDRDIPDGKRDRYDRYRAL